MSSSPAERVDALLAVLPGAVRRARTPAETRPVLPTGIGDLDRALGGGLPRDALCEVVGPRGSGRTLIAHRLLASSTCAGETAALVDLPDALDPASPALEGADLSRILWVRPPSLQVALDAAARIVRSGVFGLVLLDLDVPRSMHLPASTWLRLARSARETTTALVLLSSSSRAGSFATVRLSLARPVVRYSGGLLEGAFLRILVARNRFCPVPSGAVQPWVEGPA